MPPRWSIPRLSANFAPVKRPLFWIVILAFVLRLAYVTSDAPTPVQFDARLYVSSALALSLAAAHPSILFDKTARESISYDLVYADFLKGESIEWLYYDPPTFDQALEWVYFSGPVYPALLGIVFWPPWSHDFGAARVVNAVLDAISCALLYWILRRTAGRTAGIVGAALFAVYPGAIIKCGELNLESLASCLTVLAVALCISAILDGRRRRFFAAGIVGGLLLLTKASLSLLIVFLGVAVVLVLWRQRAVWWGAVWRMAAGFALLVVPWILLVWMHFGAPSVRDPQYSAANFRSSNILPNRGYDLDYAREDFWTYPVGREILSRPSQYLGMYIEKFYRLWNRTYNDYRIPLVFGVDVQVWFHRLLIFSAAVGLFFWPTRQTRYAALVAIAALAYASVMHSVWHSLTRYALPVIPLAIGAAGVGIVAVAEEFARKVSLRRCVISTAAVIITLLAWVWLDVGHVLEWFGALAPETANLLVVCARAVILAGDVCLLAGLLGWSRRTKAMFATLLVAGQAVLWVKSLPRERWAEWSTVLHEPDQAVERVVQLPQGYDWKQFEEVSVLADIQSGGGEKFVLNVQLDSTLYPFPGGEYAHFFYQKGSYRPFLEAYRMKKEQLRQWVTIAVPPEDIERLFADERVLVRLWVSEGDEGKDWVRVFGDYRPRTWRQWEGPSVAYSSVERLYEEGDPRIWEGIPRDLAGAENRWLDHDEVNSSDLSPAAGLQSGDYRIIIRGTTGAGTNVYF